MATACIILIQRPGAPICEHARMRAAVVGHIEWMEFVPVEAPQRRGFTFLDEAGERTITTIGRKLHPRGHDESLPWHELAKCECVYVCAGDADALLLARR